MTSPNFMNHHLMLCSTRLAFQMGCEESSVFSLEDWTTERELKQTPLRVKDPKTNKELPLIPDGSFTLLLRDRTKTTFHLEIDRGTIPKRLKSKLRLYLALSGGEDSLLVLFVVPSEARAQTIARWALEEAEELSANPTIFFLTTQDKVSKKTVLASPIWQVVGRPEHVSLESLALDSTQIIGEANFATHGGLVS